MERGHINVAATLVSTPASPGTSDSEPGSPAGHHTSKRRRAALACERCKARKQRCSMGQGTLGTPCESCQRAGAQCVMPHKTSMARFKGELIESLEQRIAVLETRLSEVSPDDPLVTDHLMPAQPTATPPQYAAHSKNDFAAGVALLSLNAAGEPHYLGASSAYTWTQLIGGTLRQPSSALLLPKETFRWRYANPQLTHSATLPSEMASQTLLDTVYSHVQARYPFVDWKQMKQWFSNREELIIPRKDYELSDTTSRPKGTASFFIWMVYAIGARLLQGSNVPGIDAPEVYYAAALEHLDLIVTLHNLQNVQALLLLILYSLRCAEGLSVRHLTVLAMSLCFELGLHRRRPHIPGSSFYAEELRKRAWWTVYSLDRWFALKLGRPLGVADDEVDQTLPCDVPCNPDVQEVTPSLHSEARTTARMRRPTTSMTSALHLIRLRQIMGRIQTKTFSLNKPSEDVTEAVDNLLQELEAWDRDIPVWPSSLHRLELPCGSEDWFVSQGELARLTLLRPLVSGAAPGDRYLELCAQAAAHLCELKRRLHQKHPLPGMFSLTDLHDIFLTGLTLLHCVQRQPTVLPFSVINSAVRACSTCLFVYAQHFAAAEHFKDAFEDIATACLERLSQLTIDSNLGIAGSSTSTNEPQIASWQAYALDMAAWMRNPAAQVGFLQLIGSLGFNPAPTAHRDSTPNSHPGDGTPVPGISFSSMNGGQHFVQHPSYPDQDQSQLNANPDYVDLMDLLMSV